MKISTTKIKYSRTNSDGTVVGQCPACEEQGHDLNDRNHLKVWPEAGGFNCIVNRGNKEHNRRILELIGDGAKGRPLDGVVPRVTVKPHGNPKKVVVCSFGRLGHLFSTLHMEK